MKVIKINKYDLIIYGCLAGAIICLGIGAKDYFASSSNKGSVKSELSSAIKEVKDNENNPEEESQKVEEVEPDSLEDYDKKLIVDSYFSDILDEIIKDDTISYEMLRSWNNYEILEFRYIREIATDYYQYEVDIKINEKNAILPKETNKNLSNDEYNVITLNIFILENAQNDSFRIRKIDV